MAAEMQICAPSGTTGEQQAGDASLAQRTPENTPLPGGGSWRWDPAADGGLGYWTENAGGETADTKE